MARRSIIHPNTTDVRVLDSIISCDQEKIQSSWIAEDTEIEQKDVARSIKWLVEVEKISKHGRGRGTYYQKLVNSNDLELVNHQSLGDGFRKHGGPTVREVVLAILNTLEPLQKVSPGEIIQMAQTRFPEENLKRESFGQIFSNLANDANIEVFAEGNARARRLWRGTSPLEGAAELPEINLISDEVVEEVETEQEFDALAS